MENKHQQVRSSSKSSLSHHTNNTSSVKNSKVYQKPLTKEMIL